MQRCNNMNDSTVSFSMSSYPCLCIYRKFLDVLVEVHCGDFHFSVIVSGRARILMFFDGGGINAGI